MSIKSKYVIISLTLHREVMKRYIEKKIGPTMRKRIRELILSEGITKVELSDGLINDLIDCGQLITLKRGEPLIAIGESNPDFYILIEGIMRQWYYNENVEVTSAFGIAGTQILDFHCYTAHEPSRTCFEPCCKTKLMRVPRSDYDRMLHTSLEFCNWRLKLAYDQFYFTEMRDHVIKGDARQRYFALLKSRPEIIQKVPLKIIATYLGITPQYLSYLRNSVP